MDGVDERWGSWVGSALVVRGGELVDEAATGATGSAPCTSSTRFQAGSISKQVMSVVVLALGQRGRLQLDLPVGHWLDDLPARLRPVTLAQLLSHSSGMGHWGDVPGLPPVLESPPPRSDLLAMVTDAPLLSAPGDRFRYSGPGFLLVAAVVEAVTGTSYGEVAAELVFSPAGMRATTSGRFPVGDSDVALGRRDGREVVVDEGFSHLPGTGDLWTTTTDLLRYSSALRHGELLDASAASLLWTLHTELDAPDPDEQPTAARSYGYGTFLGRVAGRGAWYVPGDNPGYQSLLAHLPGPDVTIAVLGSEQASGVGPVLMQLDTGV
ncbi:serine hydrolase domain-containing protein [Auraticoccus monumenti]|uniref:CubicO group peptidase, beta-lactamase class C family n=1 Tax=Auraticoccus monumenti TaxID=675864 RepID=A0A1G6ZI21_9ACTN|nr:serine hydrolase domain-containing protein [Auraticoccus monumenti]SDE02083.1 CubicO group peptidase, beta-lactamase class C family [Auraticoccus monumenti]